MTLSIKGAFEFVGGIARHGAGGDVFVEINGRAAVSVAVAYV